jgi:hypothetical protein
VEGSPRPSVQKATTSETAAISSEKAALPTQQAAQTSKASSDATPVPKSAIGSKGKKKRQAAAAASEADGGPKPPLQLEEGDEGSCYTTNCSVNWLSLVISILYVEWVLEIERIVLFYF